MRRSVSRSRCVLQWQEIPGSRGGRWMLPGRSRDVDGVPAVVVTTWDQLVRPGLDRGMFRDDFAARDQTRGAPPLRRTADVYDMILGSDPLRVERRADGTLNVINGRRRIEIASELGISHLPAAVADP